MRLFILSIILVVSVVVVAQAQGPEKKAPAFKLSADEQKLLELTNAERKKENLPPYKAHPLLFKAARDHSKNMAKQEKLEHDLDGKTPFNRLDDVKYNYLRGGENIARSAGEPTMAEILAIWMESEGHRANILKEGYTEIGIGIAKNDKGELYFTQVFAAPAME
jgi:uncharacterized protein YkwD